MPVYLVGAGARAVVLSNESDEDLCSWVPFATSLAHRGFEVALSDPIDPVSDLSSITTYLRDNGAEDVALMGASMGAKASIIAAAQIRPPVAALVSLSAEAELTSRPSVDLKAEAGKLAMPVLFATAKADPYGADEATPAYYKLASSPAKRLITVSGSAHGTALLHDKALDARVLRFLDDNVGSGDDTTTTPAASPSQPASPNECGNGPRHVDTFWLHSRPGSRLEAASIGSGPNVAIFVHEAGSKGLCGFLAYAQWIADTYHEHAILFDECGYGQSICADNGADEDTVTDTAAAVRYARSHGAERVTLVGASAGAITALASAAKIRPAVDAVVDLSGESVYGTELNSLKVAPDVHVPALFVVAKDDPYVTVPDMNTIYLLCASPHKRLVVLPSAAGHGWEMLQSGLTTGAWTPLAHQVAEWIAGRTTS